MELVIGSELARHIGITSQMVTKYKNAGVLDDAKAGFKGKRQLYDKQRAVELINENADPNYRKDAPQIKNRGAGGNGEGDSKSDTFNQWRTSTEMYKAADRKLEYEIKAKKYLKREDVERLLFIIGRQLRESLLNAPARTAARVAAKSKKSEKQIYQILYRENELTLKDCASKLKRVVL
jgi:hypothetical protein